MSNSIWKTGSPKGIHEEDRLGDYYVAEFHREDGSSFYEAGGTCDICGIPDRWTFLTDLIAQADKAERLQKQLDIAMGALKNIQWFCYAPTMGERAGRMQHCADETLEQIHALDQKGAK